VSVVRIDREWAMPNKKTFSIKPIAHFIEQEIEGCEKVVDPFARNARVANITNDLNPECDADFHLDGLEFLKRFGDDSVDAVLYDPPYSPRQLKECYDNVGLSLTFEQTSAGYWGSLKKEISRIICSGGIALSFGWNTQGIGMSNGFEKRRILMVAHGGMHNDTLCVSEVKL